MSQCRYCQSRTVKNGKDASGKQRYRCCSCERTFIDRYTYLSCGIPDQKLINLSNEGLGTSSISRILAISKGTVTKRILRIAASVNPPPPAVGAEYEVDEMWTFIGSKKNPAWIAYALNKQTGDIVYLAVSHSKSNKMLAPLINKLLHGSAKRIFTDGLINYRGLIPEGVHVVRQKGTSRIERMNLNIRTHIKRLSRKTICYSKSMAMLIACLKIYFWG